MHHLVAAALLSLAACAHPSRALPTAREPDQVSARRARVVAAARELLHRTPPVARDIQFGSDPVGFVRAAYWAAGVELFDEDLAIAPHLHDMEVLYRTASERRWLHRETPRPGDLIFLDRDTRGTALFPAQVAVVEAIPRDGTFTALGWFAAGPARIRVNLRSGVSDILRGEAPHPAAALFRAFASPYLNPSS